MKKIPIIIITIHYASKILIYTFFMPKNQTLKWLKIIHVMQH